jgi:hypothetical protein
VSFICTVFVIRYAVVSGVLKIIGEELASSIALPFTLIMLKSFPES